MTLVFWKEQNYFVDDPSICVRSVLMIRFRLCIFGKNTTHMFFYVCCSKRCVEAVGPRTEGAPLIAQEVLLPWSPVFSGFLRARLWRWLQQDGEDFRLGLSTWTPCSDRVFGSVQHGGWCHTFWALAVRLVHTQSGVRLERENSHRTSSIQHLLKWVFRFGVFQVLRIKRDKQRVK